MDPVRNEHFHITQPGSTVATSLIAGEVRLSAASAHTRHCTLLTRTCALVVVIVQVQAAPKHIALLQIRIDNDDPRYMMTPIPLLNVRPFYLVDDIQLGAVDDLDINHPDARAHVKEYLMERVRDQWVLPRGFAHTLTVESRLGAGGAPLGTSGP